MKVTVFYSWHSDLPRATNRTLILECLEAAVARLNADDRFELEVRVDRDTLDAAGAVGIADTVLSKIADADIFVGDVTPIGEVGGRKMPNPNVLTELGFAAEVIGWDGIILVCNTAHAALEELPFDIRGRRTATYKADGRPSANTTDRLTDTLAGAVKDCRASRTLGLRRQVDAIVLNAERQCSTLQTRLYDDQAGDELDLGTLLEALAKLSDTVTPHLIRAIDPHVSNTFYTEFMAVIDDIDELAARGFAVEKQEAKRRATAALGALRRQLSLIRDQFRLGR